MASFNEAYAALDEYRAALSNEMPQGMQSMMAASAAPAPDHPRGAFAAFASPLQNVHASGVGIRLRAGKAVPGDFVIMKKLDKASPNLSKFCVLGKHIPDVVLSCAKSGDGQKEFFKITFKEVLITSVQLSGSSGSEMMESVTLSYADMEEVYKPQDEKGGMGGDIKFGWNIKSTETR